MRRHRLRVLIVVLLASAGSTFAASRCPSTRGGTARLRTMAWVNTTCRTDADGIVGRQEVVVRRGDRAPVVVSRAEIGPIPDPAGLCRSFGAGREGPVSVLAGFYTSLAVSPDGGSVAFELNDGFSLLAHERLPEELPGLYLARADGGEVERIAPATGVPPYRALPSVPGGYDFNNPLTFSPDGRYVVYSDLGPASDGNIDAQLWSLRLEDRKRTQLTHLARPGGEQSLFYFLAFGTDTTIVFIAFDYEENAPAARQEFYSVTVDGKRLRKLSPIVGPGGVVLPRFDLTGRRPAAQGLFVDGMPENPLFDLDKPRELFLATGGRILQLTHFNRVETGNLRSLVSPARDRVFFVASADPFGCNPTHNCQVFSVDTLGGRLRQLTRLEEAGGSDDGCLLSQNPGCIVSLVAQDRATRALLFNSQCDPFGTNPAGNQLFAVRPDGSGLRQITQARGIAIDTPEVVEVELPGPFAYQ